MASRYLQSVQSSGFVQIAALRAFASSAISAVVGADTLTVLDLMTFNFFWLHLFTAEVETAETK